MSANLENSAVPPDWRKSVFIPVPECSNYHTVALISHVSKIMFKILQARLQQYVNWELPYVCWRCHLCEQWSLTNPRGKWHLLVVMHTSTALVRGPEDQDQASRGSHAREGGTGNHWSSLVACSGFPPQWAVIPWKWLSALNGGSAACDFAPGLSRTQRKNVWLNSLQARAIVLSPAGHWVTWRASKRTDIQAPVGFLMCLSGA